MIHYIISGTISSFVLTILYTVSKKNDAMFIIMYNNIAPFFWGHHIYVFKIILLRNIKKCVTGCCKNCFIYLILLAFNLHFQEFISLLETGDVEIKDLDTLVDYNQSLLQALGVSHPSLQNIINICSQHG